MTADPLAQLRDWHLPPPPGWWPPAPGWWVLAVLLLALMLVAVIGWRRRRARGASTRAALRELARIRARFAADGDSRAYAAAVSTLLRRLALVRYPRQQVAGLSGRAWLAFLDATGGAGFGQDEMARLLTESAYRPRTVPDEQTAGEVERLARLAADWIRADRRPTP